MLIIHQIFSLACDSSRHLTWPNIPQLKLGNMREYSPIFKTLHVAKKIWSIFCSWTLSVPRSSQFSSTYVLGKLFASQNRKCLQTNILACFRTKWRLLFIYFIYIMTHIVFFCFTIRDQARLLLQRSLPEHGNVS